MSEDTGSAASSVDDLEDGGRRDAAISSAAASDSDLETNVRTDTTDVSVAAPDVDLEKGRDMKQEDTHLQ